MLTIALAIVVLVLVWILVREHQGARKIFNNEREKKDIIKRYMDLNHTHMMLTGTLQKAEAVNEKYTLILNVIRSRFPHAWEIVINELFPQQEVDEKSRLKPAVQPAEASGTIAEGSSACEGVRRAR